jgi:hexosaminidase
MYLTTHSRVVVASESLVPLGKIVSEEIAFLSGLSPSVVDTADSDGDIVLALDSNLGDEEYTLTIDSLAVITGGSATAVAWGTVTLLQLLKSEGDSISLPHVTISDEPSTGYRGLMIDLARKWHTIDVVKECVVLCRWYKIRYLQLHLTDDPLWTFPSTAYPELATPGSHYTLDELTDLEAYASARGVTIIPEMDIPGHSAAFVKALPDLVATNPPAGNAISPGRESTYEVLDTLIGEICDVFKSTPYFHIGADEVNDSAWSDCTECAAYRLENDIPDNDELYRHFIVRLHEIVKKHGKKTIVWEGFTVDGAIRIPDDILVMEFESHYEDPRKLLSAGYSLINTSWQPLYVVNDTNWSPEKIYAWNIYRWEHWWEKSMAYGDGIDVPSDSSVIGAQICAWEQPAEIEISSLRQRAAALSERLWDHANPRPYPDFAARMESTDAKLSKIVR